MNRVISFKSSSVKKGFLRGAAALLTFVALSLATLSPASALNYDPVCLGSCNFMQSGGRVECNWLYEDESSEWHECHYHVSLDYFGCRATCIQYSDN